MKVILSKLVSKLKEALILIWNLLYPPQCIACEEILDIGDSERLCPICKKKWESAKGELRKNLKGVPSIPMTIEGIKEEQSGLITSLCEYRSNSPEPGYDVQRKLIFSLKRYDNKVLVDFISDELYKLIREVLSGYIKDKNTVIVSMPRNRINMIRDGVDNMRSVGKRLSELTGFEYIYAIKHKFGVREQKRLNAKQRQKNVEGKIYIKKSKLESFKNKRVLLIDDVVTSGSGLRQTAKELIINGKAKQVLAFTVAMNSEHLLDRV